MSVEHMRIVFMGTPEYAAICLQVLLEAGHQVVGVFTQPDRPKGRGGKVEMPLTKLVALEHGIPVFQPRRIRDEGLEDLKALKPDLCVTAAYGQILSQDILDVPPLGTVNVHASLLPEYRGSSPANWVIINGEKTTGVTTMMTDAGIDTGDILLQKSLDILKNETAGELTLRLARLGAALLLDTIERIKTGTCPRQKQDENKMSYYPMLTKQTGFINWDYSAKEIQNLILGVQPWPGANTGSPWGMIKIISADVMPSDKQALPGTILTADTKQGLIVQTGEGNLLVKLMQAPGGKAMDSKDYLRGHPYKGEGSMKMDEVNT